MIFLIFFCALFDLSYTESPQYKYETKYLSVNIDHFSYAKEVKTFPLRYLISKASWKLGKAIFFYTGNEGDITLFAKNTGFMWELAQEMSAMVVFAEHRFYGKSLPFGNQSFTNSSYYGYLNAEQALADYSTLIDNIKTTTPGAKSSAVIVFGGSYGGMLSAYFRYKYPNVVAGAIAASAPVLMVANDTDCNAAFRILTNAYRKKGSAACVSNIRQFWKALDTLNTSRGLVNISNIFHTCKPLKSVDGLKNLLSDTLFSIGMANYPYPSSFLAPMPAWPVTEVCKPMSIPTKDPLKLVADMAKGVSVYFNYTGKTKCINVDSGIGGGLNANGWNIQTCSELPMPMCQNGVTDMFFPLAFSRQQFDKNCLSSYGFSPRWRWAGLQFGARRYGTSGSGTTNTVFSNGALDPWAAGGVYRVGADARSRGVLALLIPNGAHHVDLRGNNPHDTSDIREARKFEAAAVRVWIEQWRLSNQL